MRSRNQRSRNQNGTRAQSHRNQGNWGNQNSNYGRSRSFGSRSNNSVRDNDYMYDEPYGEDYNYSDSYRRNTDDYNRGYRNSYRNSGRDSGNMLERAGERIRDKWNEWTDNDDNVYASRYRARRSYGNGNGRDNGENIFNKAGRKIRETWDDWTDRDDYDNRRYQDENDAQSYYGRSYGYSGNRNDQRRGDWNSWYNGEGHNQKDYGYNDHRSFNNHYAGNRQRNNNRNVFERAADKIKEKWNDWTDNDERESEYKYRSSGRTRRPNSYGYSNRNYRHNWKNRSRQHSNW